MGRPNSHNKLSELILDIGQAVDQAPDDRAKAVIIRRLRRALNVPQSPFPLRLPGGKDCNLRHINAACRRAIPHTRW